MFFISQGTFIRIQVRQVGGFSRNMCINLKGMQGIEWIVYDLGVRDDI